MNGTVFPSSSNCTTFSTCIFRICKSWAIREASEIVCVPAGCAVFCMCDGIHRDNGAAHGWESPPRRFLGNGYHSESAGSGQRSSEIRGQRSEVRGQRSEVRGQRSEDRDQRTELGGSEVRGRSSEF